MVYNPGGQLGKSVQAGGQRPAKDPHGPFLGKAAKSTKVSRSNSNPDNPASRSGVKGKQDVPQKQKR